MDEEKTESTAEKKSEYGKDLYGGFVPQSKDDPANVQDANDCTKERFGLGDVDDLPDRPRPDGSQT